MNGVEAVRIQEEILHYLPPELLAMFQRITDSWVVCKVLNINALY